MAEQPEILANVVSIVQAVDDTLDEQTVIKAIECGNTTRTDSRFWWALDPIDGTAGFVRKNHYCIALALMEDNKPVLGFLGCPNLGPSLDTAETEGSKGVILVGSKGLGAVQYSMSDLNRAGLNDLDEVKGTPVFCSSVSDLPQVRTTESFEVRGFARDLNAHICSELKITVPSVKMDSQCKYALVARGESELYLRLSTAEYRESIWDHAAGVIVVEEAGGRVTDFKGQELDFSLGRKLRANQGIVCSNNQIFDKVLQVIRDMNPLGIFTQEELVLKHHNHHNDSAPDSLPPSSPFHFGHVETSLNHHHLKHHHHHPHPKGHAPARPNHPKGHAPAPPTGPSEAKDPSSDPSLPSHINTSAPKSLDPNSPFHFGHVTTHLDHDHPGHHGHHHHPKGHAPARPVGDKKQKPPPPPGHPPPAGDKKQNSV